MKNLMDSINSFLGALFLGAALGTVLGMTAKGYEMLPAWFASAAPYLCFVTLLSWSFYPTSRETFTHLTGIGMVFLMPILFYVFLSDVPESDFPLGLSKATFGHLYALIACAICLFYVSGAVFYSRKRYIGRVIK